MTSFAASRSLAAALLVGAGLAPAAPAFAQLGGGSPGLNSLMTSHAAPAATSVAPPTPAPAAIPGSHAAPEPAAPAERLPLDMPPNEALFDAINRGDLAAARDAIARGADLNGRNLLGMTPLELSVDLGRNEISFLLLSMHNSGGSAGGPPRAAAAGSQPAPSVRAERASSRLSAHRVEAAPVATAEPAVAISGGTPVPSAGFLGFDIGRVRQ